jgi:uncharacterized protein
MTLEMRDKCERCGVDLSVDEAAWICVYECTFCKDCVETLRHVCPNCGGELVRRPRPAARDA